MLLKRIKRICDAATDGVLIRHQTVIAPAGRDFFKHVNKKIAVGNV
jgi:hypothetical protein